MSWIKLLYKFTRYKTVCTFLLLTIPFVFIINILFMYATKFPMRPGAEFPQSLFNVRPRWNVSNNARETTRLKKTRETTNLQKPREMTNLQKPRETTNLQKPRETTNLQKPRETTNLQKPRETTSQVLSDCDTWCHRGENVSPPYNMSLKYNLAAVLLVRVYRDDRAGLTSREMLQWLFYLRYAGFDHVFIYDAYVAKNESQYDVLNPLIQSGYVTYVDWSVHNPYTIEGTQIAAYRHCVNKYGENVRWQMAIDIDEYPFSPIDVQQSFMQRFLKNYTKENPNISQITLANYLFLGKPLNHRTNPLLIDRIRRRTRKQANDLGKSLYKSSHIQLAQVHHNDMRKGDSVDCDPRLLRLNHYWGARLQDWGEDTPKVLKISEPDFSMKPIIDEINRCSKCLGEDSLYARRWN